MSRPLFLRGRLCLAFLVCGVVLCLSSLMARGQETTEQRLDDLEQQINALQQQPPNSPPARPSRTSIGGYGEIHINVTEEPGNDESDIHRAVLYIGHNFNDWIRLNWETEIEHGFIKDGNGEVNIEQLHVNFRGTEALNVSAGRVLVPVGRTNLRHFPTEFHGVERPLVDQVVIPTTWSADGAGVYGILSPKVTYEAYLTSSLDGSKFTALEGMRGGRIKERPGLSQLAVSGRMDYYPRGVPGKWQTAPARVAVSAFTGGVGNANKGKPNPVDASVMMLAADADYTVGAVDLRGELAYGRIRGAESIGNNVASAILGWYVEGGWHCLPAAWKTGKLAQADAVLFARYERANTQHRVPEGVTKNLAGDRTQTTVGLSFLPVPTLVVKADYQFKDDASAVDPGNQWNLGLGWLFH